MSDLNRNELEALRILWNRDEPLKPAELQAEFGWPIENATLRSVLAVLVRKGHAVREKHGKAFFYRAKGSSENLLKRMTSMLAHVFSGGSKSGLLAQLIRTEKISPAELDELRRIAAGATDAGDIHGKSKTIKTGHAKGRTK